MVFLLPSLCSPGTSSCTWWHSPQAEPEGEQRYQGVAETFVDAHNIVMGMGSETRTHSLSRPASKFVRHIRESNCLNRPPLKTRGDYRIILSYGYALRSSIYTVAVSIQQHCVLIEENRIQRCSFRGEANSQDELRGLRKH